MTSKPAFWGWSTSPLTISFWGWEKSTELCGGLCWRAPRRIHAERITWTTVAAQPTPAIVANACTCKAVGDVFPAMKAVEFSRVPLISLCNHICAVWPEVFIPKTLASGAAAIWTKPSQLASSDTGSQTIPQYYSDRIIPRISL